MNYFTSAKLLVEVPDLELHRCNLALLQDGDRLGFLSYCLTNYSPENLDKIRVDFKQLEQLWQDLSAMTIWKDSVEEMLHFIVVYDWGLHNGEYSSISEQFLKEALAVLFSLEDTEDREMETLEQEVNVN